MPLTGNTNYNNVLNTYSTNTGISEQWLFELRNDGYGTVTDGTQYIRLSTAEVSGYDSLITNNPSIRENIDLVQSTSKNGNISINCVNATLSNHSATLAEEIYGGTRRYINHDVVILSRVGGYTLQIYSGRLKSVSLTNQDTVSIEIAARTPIDYLKIPRYTSQSGKFFPIIYGNGVPETSDDASPQFLDGMRCFPVEVDSLNDGVFNCLVHHSITSDGRLHYPVKDKFDSSGFPVFSPLDGASNTSTNTYEGQTNSNKNILQTPDYSLLREYKVRPTNNVTYLVDDDYSTVTDEESFYDGSDLTYMQLDFDSGGNIAFDTVDSVEYTIPDIVQEEHTVQSANLYIDWELLDHAGVTSTMSGKIIVSMTTSVGTNSITAATVSGNQAKSTKTVNLLDSGYSNYTGQVPHTIKVKFEANLDVDPINGGEGYLKIRAYNFYIDVKTKIENPDDDANLNAMATSSAVTNVKQLYTGADGLSKSWSSGAVTNIVQMHRDLIYRFAGITTAPENFTALDSARNGWTIFYYLNEEIELEKLLEQCQREGGFIFRFKANDGSPQYIYLVDTPITNHTISKDDITNTRISLTPFDSLVTKRIIKHQRNSINDELLFEVECTDTTNDPRGDYNVQSEENTVTDELEILNGNIVNSSEGKTIANTNMGFGNKNSGFANYYNAIEGNPKLLVETDIINPGSSGGSSYFYLMEVGDICAFDHTNMTIEPFGQSFNGKKFIVTSLTRSPGSLKVSLREI